MTYRTKQRDVLLDKIMAYEEEPFTADDLILKLMSTSKPVSKATVYRTLDKLERDGLVRKYYVEPSESAFYQYVGQHLDCEDHYHCVCYQCERLFHIDCHIFDDLDAHFQHEHHFKIDLQRTILYGLCENCQGEVTL